MFTSNIQNKKSLKICTSVLSPITKTFFEFLISKKFSEFGNKNYKDFLGKKEYKASLTELNRNV